MSAPPVSPALITGLTGDWQLDASASDSMEPMLTFMGVPWVVRKMILAAPAPGLKTTLTEAGLSTEQHSTFANTANSYKWGADNKHVAPNGDTAPAALSMDDGGNSVTVRMEMGEKGLLAVSYAAGSEGVMHVTMRMTEKGKTAPTVVKRVFKRK